MKLIRFRQPLFDGNGFCGWHYWGMVDGVFQGALFCGQESQQYTGMRDDKTRMVFVGDIVSPINFNGSYRDAIVKFRNGCFIVESLGMCKDYECLGDKAGFRIIGNIYEHPELLQTTNDPG